MPLDDSGFLHQIYFDDNGDIIKVILHKEDTFELYRSSIQQIIELFPEAENSIMKFNELLKL